MAGAHMVGEFTVDEEAQGAREEVSEEAPGQVAEARRCGVATEGVLDILEGAAEEGATMLANRLRERTAQGEGGELGERAGFGIPGQVASGRPYSPRAA